MLAVIGPDATRSQKEEQKMIYSNILVPVDLSQKEVARRILGIARTLGGAEAKVTALFVFPDIPGYVAAEMPEEVLRENMERARAELAELAAEVGAEAVMHSGHPSTVILETAEDIGADLIVVGSHRPGFEDYLIGSTASRVVRHAKCSVLVHR